MSYKFNPLLGVGLDDVGSGGAAATPGGSDTQVQFNDGGSFGGSADLTWDDTGKVLGVGGDVDLDDGGTYATTLQTITATANRTISFPDATGTVGLVAGSSGQLIYNSAGANAGTPTLTYDGSILTSSGRFINSYNATASSPAKAFTGTWFTGGTATTTKPQVLIEPAGTTSTAWSTSGTGFGVNAPSGFAGNLLDLQVNGSSKLYVDKDGAVYGNCSSTSNAWYFVTRRGSAFTGWREHDSNTVAFAVNASSAIDSGGIAVRGTSLSEGLWISKGFGIGANSSNPNVFVYSDAYDTLAQRRGTNAQTYRLYNSYTDASNYQRTSITDDSTGLVIDQQYAGTGAARTNLLDLKVNGTSRLSLTSAGTPVLGSAGSFNVIPTGSLLGLGAGGGIHWYITTGAVLSAASNNSRIFLGASSDVGITRDQAGVIALTAGSTGTGYLKQTPVAVSALPAAATVGAGTRGFVSDSTVAASGNFGATVTGGGSNNVPVFSDGTNWLIG